MDQTWQSRLVAAPDRTAERSEERRVGKECRWRWSRYQAEDGIRDWSVTGVQTCALPICLRIPLSRSLLSRFFSLHFVRRPPPLSSTRSARTRFVARSFVAAHGSDLAIKISRRP